MPGNDSDKNKSPDADFFGEDVDWLDDDDDEVVQRRGAAGGPQPPPFPGAPGLVPKDPARVEWERRNAPYGSDLSRAKTLIHSAVPTDVPEDDDAEGPTSLGDLSRAAPGSSGPSMVPEDEQPTTQVSADDQRAALDAARRRSGVEADDAPAEAVLDGVDAETPLVRTAPPPRPAPIDPLDAPAPNPTLTPWTPPRPLLMPPADVRLEDRWRMMTAALITEAAAAPDQAGPLLYRAGWIYQHRLGDLAGAEGLYRNALTSSCRDPLFYRELANVWFELGRWAEAADLLHERAALLDGALAAESLRESGLVRLRRLRDAAEGTARLWDSLGADPEDVASLAYLRDTLSAPGVAAQARAQLPEVLARLAALSSGSLAADAWVDRGHLLDDADAAAAAYAAALEADPEHPDALASLEALYRDHGEHAQLAALYDAQVARADADVGWWSLLAARAHLAAGQVEPASRCFDAAVAAGWALASDERLGRLLGSGAHGALVEQLLQRVESGGASAAFLWFRIGWLRERHLDDLDGARDAYRRAVQAAPAAAPAYDALRRVAERRQDADARVSQLRRQLDAAPDDRRAPLLYRAAEAAEFAGRFDEARELYHQALQVDPDGWPARAGLARVLRALDDRPALIQAYEERAARVASPELRAHFLFCAASVGQPAPGPEAVAMLREALELVPDHLPALELLASACESPEDWASYASALDAAAAVVAETEVRVHLHYLAARIHLSRAGDPVAAQRALDACLAIRPAYAIAAELAEDVAVANGDVAGACGRYLAAAERADDADARAWLCFAAAVLSDPQTEAGQRALDALLAREPHHAAGLELHTEVATAVGRTDALVDGLLASLDAAPGPETARAALYAAELLIDQERVDEAAGALTLLAALPVEPRPLRAAALLACRAGRVDAELQLLASLDEPWAQARWATLAASRPDLRDRARSALREQLERPDPALVVALAAVRVGVALDDPRLAATGHRVLAHSDLPDAVRVAHALWAADQLARLGDTEAAAPLYRVALQLRPRSEAASVGLLGALVELRDVDALAALAGDEQAVVDRALVATSLERLGAVDAAVPVWTALAADAPSLPSLMQLQVALEGADRWQEAYQVSGQRLDATRDPSQRDEIEQRRRWMLSEHLAHTDEALAVFQQLREQHPRDVRVAEALARIAGEHKQTELAIEILSALAGRADSAKTAARYQRRVAGVYLAAGDREAARAAFLDALDFLPSDTKALAGLRELAAADEDWPAMITVLEREAGLAEGEALLRARREIARIQEEHIGDGAVAIEAWRKVLVIAPDDTAALDRAIALTEAQQAWGQFVELATKRSALAAGAERTALLRRIGLVCVERLGREDGVSYLERAISETPADHEAAVWLAEHHAEARDWKGASRALLVQGEVAPTEQERVAALREAARIELSERRDRDAAAEAYTALLGVAPDDDAALRFMATHLFEAGRFDEAAPVFRRLEPRVEDGQDLDDFDTRMELAQFYFYFAEMLRLEDDPGALERYQSALRLNATHLASLEAAGPLLYKAGEWAKAEQVYRQLLQLSGGQGERHKVAGIYTQLGLVERQLGRHDKAQKRFNKALEVCPNHVGALKGLAMLHEDREEWSALLNVYNNVIYHASVADDVISAYMTKGRVLDANMGRPEKAAQHYQRSIDFKPDQPFAHLRLAELALRRGDARAADEHASRALRIEGAELEQVRHLVLLCAAAARWAEGDASAAHACFDQARSLEAGAQLPDGLITDLQETQRYVHDRLPPT